MSEGGLPEARPRTQVRIGALWVDALTFDQAIAEIERLLGAGAGGAVFTPNVDHVVNVEKDEGLAAAYQRVVLSLADGQPLVWASRLLGTPLPEKISGSDLVPRLLEKAKEKRWRVFLLGGGPGVPEKAAEAARAMGVEARDDEAALIERVRAAKPDLILVGLGSPKQERFIDRAAPALRPALLFGIGASLDFLAGAVRRAPRWMSRSGLEWIFRLAQEPRRLGPRYLWNDPWFAVIVWKMMFTPRAQRSQPRKEGP